MKGNLFFALNFLIISVSYCQDKVPNAKLFNEELKKLNCSLCKDSVHSNDNVSRNELVFYEKDFKINLAQGCKFVTYLTHSDHLGIPLQINLLSLFYDDPKRVSSLISKLGKLDRSNLLTAVLCIFKIKHEANEILIISSETPNNDVVKKVFGN